MIESGLNELSQRWELARISAVEKVLPQENLSESSLGPLLENLSEEELDTLFRLLFLNSRALGKSYQKHTHLCWEREDFQSYLKALKSPCLQGEWENTPVSSQLSRPGCSIGKKQGHLLCQYWRESIDGLVLGLSDDVGYARHSSIHFNADSCQDVFFDDEETHTDAIWENPARWAPFSKPVAEELKAIEQEFSRMEICLNFLGLAEDCLVYKMEAKTPQPCGASTHFYRNLLTQKIKKKFPLFQLKDASPVAVYGEGK